MSVELEPEDSEVLTCAPQNTGGQSSPLRLRSTGGPVREASHTQWSGPRPGNPQGGQHGGQQGQRQKRGRGPKGGRMARACR